MFTWKIQLQEFEMEKKPAKDPTGPPKVMPKPTRERSKTLSSGFKLPLISKSVKTGSWKENALEFHGQISTEIERLIQKMDDQNKATEAHAMLEKAQLSSSRVRVTPESFMKKAELLVTLLQRISTEKVTLQDPLPKLVVIKANIRIR